MRPRLLVGSRMNAGLDDLARLGCLLLAVVGIVAAPFVGDEAGPTLAANGLLLAILIGMDRVLAALAPQRPMRFTQLFLLMSAIQPLALILSALLEGEVRYETLLGSFSHNEASIHVALTYLVFDVALFAGILVVLVARPRRDALLWHAATAQLGFHEVRALQLAAVVAALLKVVILFPDTTGTVAGYFIRLYIGYFSQLTFFIGVGWRRQIRGSFALASVVGVAYALVLIAGNRGDALVPLGFLTCGWLVAAPVGDWKRVVGLAVALALAVFGMFVGSVLRTDQEGRSGDAALSRLDTIGERISSSDSDELRQESLRRFLRNSSHAVLTLIPDRFPYDPAGLSGLPQEMRENLLPGLHFEGTARGKESRNWMLNELGFLVNWNTSVELAVVPDAWFRASWLGLAVVGFIVGLIVQVFEELSYAGVQKRPLRLLIPISMFGAVVLLEGRDVVWGLRGMIWNYVSAYLAYLLMHAAISFVSAPARRPAEVAR